MIYLFIYLKLLTIYKDKNRKKNLNQKMYFKLIFIIIYLIFILINGQNIRREHAAELRAVKGQFFVHMLHSAYFFPQTVDVKWSASVHGRPILPQWIHLIPSKHRSIAFLIGTPVSPHSHFPLHIIAKRIDSFENSEQTFSIITNEDLLTRFTGTTRQIAEIYLTNINAEELLWGVGRDNKLKNLEKAIHLTFKGKHVNPYIFNILSGTENALDLQRQFQGNILTGAIIQIGTQLNFHLNVQHLSNNMQQNKEFCSQNKNIPMDRNFRPEFKVDWCKFYLKNVTIPLDLEQHLRKMSKEGKNAKIDYSNENMEILGIKKEIKSEQILNTEHDHLPSPPVYYIWESVLVFPLLAVFCLLFILCLSFIFFGRREGQHWRDYKTPKNQLDQYLNLRESQHHLREMSQQRQLLLSSMSHSGREQSDTTISIGTFLRPKEEEEKENNQIKSASLPERISNYPPSSIGKQTVAEAARANGLALNLYRHPINNIEDNENNRENEGKWLEKNKWSNTQRWNNSNGGMQTKIC
ncbi:hypothetical protein Mgra_00000935 [Meloidogyne graminicola]|uniref:Epsilon-sarcoglycan n=1 Tax=Meloidogyne graminicola TaxID=189291 RepID=A0A8T0A0Q3_9BILA|nr:hypothetical protein Mgra_00000935 [Meloidogyne graminicola]